MFLNDDDYMLLIVLKLYFKYCCKNQIQNLKNNLLTFQKIYQFWKSDN